MDSQQGVCLFFQRTGTCKAGDKCPLSHVREQRGITTKYDDRIWQHSQASTSEAQQAQQAQQARRRSISAFAQAQQQEVKGDRQEQQTAKWDFRVMTYNILAEGLATAHGELLYQQVPTWCLKWNYRWPGLLAEIVHYKPDVMSLQEVDHFEELAAKLEPLGYEGRYAQRSGGRSDGCATFWRKDLFIAVAVDIIRFQSYGLQDNVALLVLLHRKASFSDGEDTASEGVVEVRMTVDESGDVSMLSGEVNKWFRLHAEMPVDTLMDPALLVANTHILFNPKRGDIKIAQLRTLLNVMNDIVRKCNNNALGMVMGDFNSTPESAVYQFIRAGELDCQTVPRKHVSGQVQGTSWPAALEKMARRRSAPAALSIQSLERLVTPPATPSSPQRSEFWGSPPQKSPTHRNPRKKRGPGAGAGAVGLSRGMKHVASEPQLFEMDKTGDAAISRSTVDPLKFTAHTVPVQQTLPDTEPPLASSSAGSPRQPGSAPLAGVSTQRPQLAHRPNSTSSSRGDLPLTPQTAARVAEAVHKDDASLLDGVVIPSISSHRELSTTSLSTIAESGSDVGNSQENLRALDQVAEKLCELSAADSTHSDDTDARTDRSSFEFPTKKDLYASSPAQVSAFPSPAKLRCSPLGPKSASIDSATRTQLQSAAAEADASLLENGDRAAQGSGNLGGAGFASGSSTDSTHSSVSSSTDFGTSRQTAPGSDSPLQKSFSITDSALFAPTALKPRTVSQELTDDAEYKASGRKLQQISSDSEIVIHVSPGHGHETPFTSGPYTCKGSDPCPTLPSSPAAAVSARAAAAAAAAAALTAQRPMDQSEGLPQRPFSPPALPMVAESSSEFPSDSALEQRDSSSSIMSPSSRAAADVGIFSPRRLPPRLTHTRVSGLGDGPRLSGDGLLGSGDQARAGGDKPPIPGDLSGRPSSERARFSGEKPRLSKDGPPLVRKPLFRDDSCTWSPEQLQMAVGGPPLEDLSPERPEGGTLTRAESAGSPGRIGASGQDPEPTWVARHPLKLRSAYSEVTGSEPHYTTCHSKFLGTVDYMWYTPQADKGTTLVPTKTLVPPPLEHLYCGLPSPEWQSDHMSLVTDFSVQRRVSKNSILLSGLHKEANMVRARSKLVDSEVFEAAMVNNRNRMAASSSK